MCWHYFTLSVLVSDSLFSWSNFLLNKSLIHKRLFPGKENFTILMLFKTLHRFSGLLIKVVSTIKVAFCKYLLLTSAMSSSGSLSCGEPELAQTPPPALIDSEQRRPESTSCLIYLKQNSMYMYYIHFYCKHQTQK